MCWGGGGGRAAVGPRFGIPRKERSAIFTQFSRALQTHVKTWSEQVTCCSPPSWTASYICNAPFAGAKCLSTLIVDVVPRNLDEVFGRALMATTGSITIY